MYNQLDQIQDSDLFNNTRFVRDTGWFYYSENGDLEFFIDEKLGQKYLDLSMLEYVSRNDKLPIPFQFNIGIHNQ